MAEFQRYLRPGRNGLRRKLRLSSPSMDAPDVQSMLNGAGTPRSMLAQRDIGGALTLISSA
jgi:hypothetical protein